MSRLTLRTLAAMLLITATQGTFHSCPYKNWDILTGNFVARLDFDRNGILTELDFSQRTSHHVFTLGLSGAEALWVRDNYVEIWNLFDSCSPSQDITRETFPDVFQCVGGYNCKKAADVIFRLFYNVIDVDQDDTVTETEFVNLLEKVYAQSGDFARTVFDNLDTNGDGFVSWEEYWHAQDKWLSNRDYPNTGFFDYVYLEGSPSSDSRDSSQGIEADK